MREEGRQRGPLGERAAPPPPAPRRRTELDQPHVFGVVARELALPQARHGAVLGVNVLRRARPLLPAEAPELGEHLERVAATAAAAVAEVKALLLEVERVSPSALLLLLLLLQTLLAVL